ncbi:MAG TPA: universal stress protein [Solirubrobacter sp.]|nr:universal stress protein [Solirubrobacter sp.]
MTVVAGHDGSDCGDDAVALGAQLARATGEDLLVVSVYPQENPIGPGRVDAEWVAYMREQAEEGLAGVRRTFGDDGVAYRAVGSESAAHGLDDVAEAEGASLIAVGSSRRGARRRISPGSTGERLLHGASCPVAVAPRGHRDRSGASLERIGVGFLDTTEGREAARVAGSLAERMGAAVILYTVIAPRAEVFSPIIGWDAEQAFLATVREDARDAQARMADTLTVPVSCELLEGEAIDALAALDEREVDLLVCGSRGYGPLRRVLLGGVLRHLIRRAACPVVVVPRHSAESSHHQAG